MGGARAGAGWRESIHDERDDRVAGPASDRGASEPHRPCARSRSPHLQRTRTRGGVAADPVAAIGEREDRARPHYRGSFETRARVRQERHCHRGDVERHQRRGRGAFGRVHTDPRNILRVAEVLAQRLAAIDSANAAFYQGRYKDFSSRWGAAITRWEQQAATLKGASVIVHHKNMSYLLNWLGMSEAGALEPKPGIEPSAAHLAALMAQLQVRPAGMVIRAAYQDARASEWLADRAKIPAVVLPFTVGGSERAKDLFGLFDDPIARLLAARK